MCLSNRRRQILRADIGETNQVFSKVFIKIIQVAQCGKSPFVTEGTLQSCADRFSPTYKKCSFVNLNAQFEKYFLYISKSSSKIFHLDTCRCSVGQSSQSETRNYSTEGRQRVLNPHNVYILISIFQCVGFTLSSTVLPNRVSLLLQLEDGIGEGVSSV